MSIDTRAPERAAFALMRVTAKVGIGVLALGLGLVLGSCKKNGASGNPEARIFALSMVPELVSIGGIYRTFEDGFPPELARVPTQIRRVGDRLDILAVTQASRA